MMRRARGFPGLVDGSWSDPQPACFFACLFILLTRAAAVLVCFFATFSGAFGVIFFSAMTLSLLVALLGLDPTGESSFVTVEGVVMNDRSGRCSPSR